MRSIRVGVTGHRVLHHYHKLVVGVRSVLERIESKARDDNHGKHRLVVISPLAEGADRLVAREILNRSGVLEAPLPFPVDDYLPDFATHTSRKEFQQLLSLARSIIVMPATNDRRVAYEFVGRYVVDNCDVLLVLWDGNKSTGRGGTADIVDYAQKYQKTIYWIHTYQPEKITALNINTTD